MDQDCYTTERLDDLSFMKDWLEGINKYPAPTAPSGSVYVDQRDGDCWEISNTPNAFNGGAPVTNQEPQRLQVPQTPAHSSYDSFSPYWENWPDFVFEVPSIQQNPSCDAKLEIAASPNPSITGTLSVPFPVNSASTINSIDTDGIPIPLGVAAVQAAPHVVDANLGRTYQILSPVAGNSSPATQVPVTGHSSQDQAPFPAPAAQISKNTIVWSTPGFVVEDKYSCSEIQFNIGSIPESLQRSDEDALNVQQSSKRIHLGKTPQRKKRPAQHKPKLHEVILPYSDKQKELKRQNAIKARKNREKHAKDKKELSDEVAKMNKLLQERDALIELLRQQRQQDRGRAMEFYRSELKRLEDEGQV